MSHQTTDTKGVTFTVSEAVRATEQLAEVDYKEATELRIDGTVEACSQLHGQLVADVDFHPLVAAAHLAFCGHQPLSFSPDMIWLLLCQGLASHVNANPEQYRDLFVQFEGKKTITVRRDDFVKGSPENPWPEVFSEFSRAIRGFVGDKYDILIQEFSTTGSHEKAAFEVAFMNTVQSYFDYEFLSLCGIPTVTLEGTTADWIKLRDQAALLAELDLQWWIPHVMPLLDQFIQASSGQVDQVFWQSLYKLRTESGGPYVTGWLVNFFPYLRGHDGAATRRSQFLIDMSELESPINQIDSEEAAHGRFTGLTHPALPSGLSWAPVLWKYFEELFEMEFYGGFVGVRQDPQTMTLRPEIGWAVRDVNGAVDLREKRK